MSEIAETLQRGQSAQEQQLIAWILANYTRRPHKEGIDGVDLITMVRSALAGTRSVADEALIAALAEALEFYADPDTYHAIAFFADPPCGEFTDDFDFDEEYQRNMPGKRARSVLELLPMTDPAPPATESAATAAERIRELEARPQMTAIVDAIIAALSAEEARARKARTHPDSETPWADALREAIVTVRRVAGENSGAEARLAEVERERDDWRVQVHRAEEAERRAAAGEKVIRRNFEEARAHDPSAPATESSADAYIANGLERREIIIDEMRDLLAESCRTTVSVGSPEPSKRRAQKEKT